MSMSEENEEFLTSQIITYIGNKRKLIGIIENEVKEISIKLNKQKLVCADFFSGSGIVSRMLKKYSEKLIVNDLENYSCLLNSCYLSNKKDFPIEHYNQLKQLIEEHAQKERFEGLITQNYAPKNDNAIQKDERVFYTHENAVLIDTYRKLIDELVDEKLRKYFLAPLITEASIHVNTSGVFKGFYKDKNTGIGCFGASGKNALSRINGKIELKTPVFSNFDCELEFFQKNAVELSKELKNLDIAYLDPPYNQHPYGSNYFMLNLILKNQIDTQISRVSGIPNNWNRSDFNKSKKALNALEAMICNVSSKYVIVSYNSEGFIKLEQMKNMLEKYGKLKTIEIKYNTFRGSRNLQKRDLHVFEYLFVLEK